MTINRRDGRKKSGQVESHGRDGEAFFYGFKEGMKVCKA
jgi:hypothetical protein